MQQQSKLEMGRLWTQEEVHKLCEYVSEHGPSNWNLAADKIGTGRTANGCRQRWIEFHQDGVKKGPFDDEEELTIMLLRYKWDGRNSWAKIARDMPGRTSNQIKNFWHSKVKKKAKDPLRLIRELVVKIEGTGKILQSCLSYNAYNEYELIRLTEAAGGTADAFSSTAPVSYPQVSDLMLPAQPKPIGVITDGPFGLPQHFMGPPQSQQNEWPGLDIGVVTGSPFDLPQHFHVQVEPPQQNEWPALDHGGVPVTGSPFDPVAAGTIYDYPELGAAIPSHLYGAYYP